MILSCILWADVLAYDNILTFTHDMYMQCAPHSKQLVLNFTCHILVEGASLE